MSGETIERINVRRADFGDIPSLHDFILRAWKEAGPSSWGWTGASDKSIQELAAPEHLAKLISNPNIRLLLAVGGGGILGFTATRGVDKETVELAGIIVKEHLTGRGVGTALMKAAMAWASDNGFKVAVVKTETFNQRAIGFYEASGFAREAVTQDEVDGDVIDLVVLRKRLRPL